MAALKPAGRQLLNDVRDRHVGRRGDLATGSDWNDRTGRDVTDQMRRLEREGLVSQAKLERPSTSLLARWQLTKAGHTAIAETAVLTGGS